MQEKTDKPPGRYDHLDVRVYPQEKKRAQELAAELGFRGAADLIRVILNRLDAASQKRPKRKKAPIHIHLPNREDEKQVAYQLAAIGNNHNQIAHQLNALAVAGGIAFDDVLSAEDLAHYFYGTTQAFESLKGILSKQ